MWMSNVLMVHGWSCYQHSMEWRMKHFLKEILLTWQKIASTQYSTFRINTKPYSVIYKGFHYLVSTYISTFISFFFFSHILNFSHIGLLPGSTSNAISLSSLLLLGNTHPPNTFWGLFQVLFPQVQLLWTAFLLLSLLQMTPLCASKWFHALSLFKWMFIFLC